MTISKFYCAILAVLSSKRGAAMVEYALLAALIAVVAISTITSLGKGVSNQFNAISTNL